MEKLFPRLSLLEPIASPSSWHVLDAASPLRFPRSVPAPLRSPRCSFLPRLAASPPFGNLPAVPAPLLPATDRVRFVSPSLQGVHHLHRQSSLAVHAVQFFVACA